MVEKKTLRKELEEMAEPEYRTFASSLIPGTPGQKLMGVRLPKLRRLSKKIAKGDWTAYLESAADDSFEEVMLQGMVIGAAKADIDKILYWIGRFLPKIDNWSTCDSFCSGLKIALEYPEEMWEFLQGCLKDGSEYTVRFAVVMLLNYYVKEPYLLRVFELLDGIRQDSYYIRMAVAWAVSICYRSFPEETMKYLSDCCLDDFTYNKSLQKIMESMCTDQETRRKIKEMKR